MRCNLIPFEYDNALIDLRFPERKFGRPARFSSVEEMGSLRSKQRKAALYVENTARLQSARTISICSLGQRVRSLNSRERKALRRRQRNEQTIHKAMNRIDDVVDMSVDELRLLVANPDVSPLVSIMAEQALQSRR